MIPHLELCKHIFMLLLMLAKVFYLIDKDAFISKHKIVTIPHLELSKPIFKAYPYAANSILSAR